jgi:signal transduction histidine kinase
VSVSEILNEALNIAKFYSRTKGRTIELNISEELPALFGVRDQFVQVFLNLILNAIDATKKGGRIGLSAAPINDWLEILVCDNGAGVPPEHASRLFQPYFTTKKHGTGLGLFVTQKLVSDHGGSVRFESRPGEGTVFHVFLPCSDKESRRPGDMERASA